MYFQVYWTIELISWKIQGKNESCGREIILRENNLTNLRDDEIVIRPFRTDFFPRPVDLLREMLTDDERRRADRFATKKLADTFTLVRAELRGLLSRILYVDPVVINIVYNNHGKPLLGGGFPDRRLHFNVSHTDSMAVIAAGWDRELGVDIEALRPWDAAMDVARRFFSGGEIEALLAVPEPDRLRAFFACWTRKEAFIKMLGGGLTIALKSFSVSVDPDSPALLHLDDHPDAANRWQLLNLNVPAPYIASIAAEGRDWHLRYDEGEQ